MALLPATCWASSSIKDFGIGTVAALACLGRHQLQLAVGLGDRGVDVDAPAHEVEIGDPLSADLARSQAGESGETDQQPVLRVALTPALFMAIAGGRRSDGGGKRHDLAGL